VTFVSLLFLFFCNCLFFCFISSICVSLLKLLLQGPNTKLPVFMACACEFIFFSLWKMTNGIVAKRKVVKKEDRSDKPHISVNKTIAGEVANRVFLASSAMYFSSPSLSPPLYLFQLHFLFSCLKIFKYCVFVNFSAQQKPQSYYHHCFCLSHTNS